MTCFGPIFFTGNPNEICTKLRAVPKFEIDPLYAKIFRPDGSIIQMKSKQLKEHVEPFFCCKRLPKEVEEAYLNLYIMSLGLKELSV